MTNMPISRRGSEGDVRPFATIGTQQTQRPRLPRAERSLRVDLLDYLHKAAGSKSGAQSNIAELLEHLRPVHATRMPTETSGRRTSVPELGETPREFSFEFVESKVTFECGSGRKEKPSAVGCHVLRPMLNAQGEHARLDGAPLFEVKMLRIFASGKRTEAQAKLPDIGDLATYAFVMMEDGEIRMGVQPGKWHQAVSGHPMLAQSKPVDMAGELQVEVIERKADCVVVAARKINPQSDAYRPSVTSERRVAMQTRNVFQGALWDATFINPAKRQQAM